jgi:hypothetical protein
VETRELLAAIRRRPGLFGLDGSFGQYCAFVEGMNAARDGQLLTGFREMLIARLGDGNNLTWPGLVRRVAGEGPVAPVLFDLLEEFLERRSRSDGLVGIYDEYLTWLRAQSWYRGSTG